MKKKKEMSTDINTYLIELEKENETLKQWGKLYMIEKNIINTIILTRKKKGLTQSDVASKTGLKQSAVSRVENMANPPKLDELIKILYVLGLKIEIKPIKKK